MTYNQAVRIGTGAGITNPVDAINNIIFHAVQLFPYREVAEELIELKQDAIERGIKFSKVCGDAIMEDEDEYHTCYICQRISKIKGEIQHANHT